MHKTQSAVSFTNVFKSDRTLVLLFSQFCAHQTLTLVHHAELMRQEL